MMKKVFALLLAVTLLVTLTACGGKKTTTPSTLPGDNPPMAEDILDQELTLEEDLLNQERAEANRADQAAIPDPPEAGDYLSGLRHDYEFVETSVEVNGAQAVYTIHVQQDNRLVDCAGIYTMTLEYDVSSGKWNRVDDGWAEKNYTLDTQAFEKYHTWVVYPHEGLSANVYLHFSQVTEDGCHIAWESMDDDITVNGSYSGEGDFTFQTGGLNDNDDYPCWVADGLEIEYEWYYSGSNHKTEVYYVQIRDNSVYAPRTDPFSNTSGNGFVQRTAD